MGVDLGDLERKLGHTFSDRELLERALTHTSHIYEQPSAGPPEGDNEQLEFLGDAILGFVVSDYLVRHNPGVSRGPPLQAQGASGERGPASRSSARTGIG